MESLVVCHHCGRMRSPDPSDRCESCGTTRPTGGAQDPYGGSTSSLGFGGGPIPPSVGYSPPSTSSSTKWILGIVALIGLSGMFCCCSAFGLGVWQGYQEEQRRLGGATTVTEPGGIARIESSDRLIAVPPYGGLGATTTLHDDAQLQLQNLPAELYLLGFSEPKTDFEGGVTLDGYGTLVTESMEVAGRSISAPTPTSIGASPAREYRIRGTVSNLPIVYWVVVAETEGHFHQLVIWTLSSRETDHAPTIARILRESVVRSSR